MSVSRRIFKLIGSERRISTLRFSAVDVKIIKFLNHFSPALGSARSPPLPTPSSSFECARLKFRGEMLIRCPGGAGRVINYGRVVLNRLEFILRCRYLQSRPEGFQGMVLQAGVVGSDMQKKRTTNCPLGDLRLIKMPESQFLSINCDA